MNSPQIDQAGRDTEAFAASISKEFGLLTEQAAGQLLALRGLDPERQRLLARREYEQDRLLALWNGEQYMYPGFQFDQHGEPLPVMGELLLTARPLGWSPWDLLFWLSAPTGYLDDARPVDLLTSRPDAVASAFSKVALDELPPPPATETGRAPEPDYDSADPSVVATVTVKFTEHLATGRTRWSVSYDGAPAAGLVTAASHSLHEAVVEAAAQVTVGSAVRRWDLIGDVEAEGVEQSASAATEPQ